ncbi:2-amino-4-hydroxy-6-hydroxymethyldihydropteridine diphosphokinase [Macrococcoides caseolyticum]|uniref:2-amino-4-hydroxy-6- hydroxymethyldihydropteridine diphosphokinase n=1 Tax=Macrococcoides caseolyticum TaxID=69966 RepID=UPI001F195F3E|nr:2-amino-4-hydroxy-6-hydroxymethyldihydropteridine diphosphokinase [Macrococcus caseolyticus]MCE4957961.1 2-amino-4-hydroxy-6-hydroxymethyldihydropteridine diphosphokinase [Macrococcus caseolyticus]
MSIVYISFGSNIGDRAQQINNALKMLDNISDTVITRVSSLYETAPVGGVAQDDFLNGVVEVMTTLTPIALLNEIQSIELKLGRKREVHWGPRTIDLDIILYDDQVIDNERLKVPHPYMHERSFVLIPLNEIAPDAVHPVLNKEINELVTLDPDVRIYK